MSSNGLNIPLARRGLLIGIVALAGCGFTPVYGPGGSGGKLQGNVGFIAPQTELGFRVRTALEDRFESVVSSTFTVEIALGEKTSAAAITGDGDTTRFDVTGTARWSLDGTNGGSVQTFTSYSATGSTVATQAAERDARARLAQALADMIATDLIFAAQTLP